MAQFETWLKTDLKKPVIVEQMKGCVFSTDNEANLIGVEILDDGAAATVSGGVTGYIVREDSATVTVIGTLSGNLASIVLPSSAYAVPGQLSVVIKVGTVTVGACTGVVYRTTTDTIVDPGHVIPSIAELLAKIADCEAATAAATAAASNANAKATLANTAAGTANTAAANADTKAGQADTAATAANAAAAEIVNMTVAASGLPAGSAPSVNISDVNNHKHIAFGIPQGAKGDKGDSGVMVSAYGPFWLEVESDTGNLYVCYADGTEAPPFYYDSTTGNLYFDFDEE